MFGFEPYYDVYEEQPERLLGLSPLGDQKLAGVVMMVEQALTLGVALVLLVRLARRERRRGAPTRSRPEMPSPWSFTFEPLFLVLAVVAVVALRPRLAPRTRDRLARVVLRRRASRSSSARSTRRSGRSRSSTSSSSTCSRT